MAKAGAEAPGTSGSQFFVVSGPNAATLPPDYAIVGNVTSGMDTVKRIDGFGDVNDPSGTPTRPVVVESVTVEES
jgi:peptidyl-prolyl cis-trans isomerase B (cyclophilin B)